MIESPLSEAQDRGAMGKLVPLLDALGRGKCSKAQQNAAERNK